MDADSIPSLCKTADDPMRPPFQLGDKKLRDTQHDFISSRSSVFGWLLDCCAIRVVVQTSTF